MLACLYIYILEDWRLPVFSTGQMVKNNTLFMEDGAPCHTAKMTKDWQDRNGIKRIRIPWSRQSLEINPIEHLWTILDRTVQKKSRKPTLRAELLNLLREAWAEIPQEKISDLVSSMPEICKWQVYKILVCVLKVPWYAKVLKFHLYMSYRSFSSWFQIWQCFFHNTRSVKCIIKKQTSSGTPLKILLKGA